MKVIGHRGAAALAPENTFASFDIAIDLGVDAIETDVQMTKDGYLVLFHDDLLDRTTDGSGRLQEKTWIDINNLDVGSWFDKKFQNEHIPLLSETLKKYIDTMSFELEIKQKNIEKEVISIIESLNASNKVIITSFDFQTVCNVKQKYPQIKVGFLTSDISENNLQKVITAHIDQFCPKATLITKELVDTCHSRGLLVRAWGVLNIELMHTLISVKVDGMTVDFPDKLLEELGRLK